MTLSPYEQQEWDRLQTRKDDALNKKARHLLPAAARERVTAVTEAVKKTPAAEAQQPPTRAQRPNSARSLAARRP